MKTTLKRLLCLSLALLMLVPLLIACRKNGDDEGEGEATSEVAGTSEATKDASDSSGKKIEYDENGYQKDQVGEQNFGGKEIRVLGWTQRSYKEFGIKFEEISEHSLGQEMYSRDLKTQARLNVKFNFVLEGGDNATYRKGYIPKAEAMVSGNEVDAFACYSMAATPLMVRGFLTDITQFNVLDFSAPWWSQDLIEKSRVYDRLYFVTGSIAPSFLGQGFAMYFNKEMTELYLKDALSEMGAESLYDLVENSQWTIDNFITLAKKVEITGATKSEDETFGYVCKNIAYDPWYFSADMVTLNNAEDGSLQISEDWNSAKTINLMDKLLIFFNSKSAGVPVTLSDGEDYTYDGAWGKGNAMFTTQTLSSLPGFVQKQAVGEAGVGVLPMPKWSSDQEKYTSTAGFYFTLWGIARNSDRHDASTAALEVLASEGYRSTEPALYDTILKTRSTEGKGSENDRKMIDLVRDSIILDAGRIHNNDISSLGWGMFRNSIMTDIKNNATNSTYASYFDGRESNLTSKLQALNGAVNTIEQIYG